MANPTYKLAIAEPVLIKSAELKLVFKKILQIEEYQKLAHFVWVKQIKKNIPGSYSVYAMYKDGIAIATNSLCINEWLDAHNIPRRKPLHEHTVKQKMLFNRDDIAKIDNRTDEFNEYKRRVGRKKGIPVAKVIPIAKVKVSSGLAEQIWELYQEGHTPADISNAIGCTAANIYYHIRKQRERLDKLAE